MVFEDYHEGLAWIADGYKHKLFASDARKSTEVLPQDDSFVLRSSEKTDTYAELRIKPPSPLQKHASRARNQRPGTAPPSYGGRRTERPWSSKSNKSRLSNESPRPPNQPRIRSAGSVVERHRVAAQMRSGFTLVNKLYEDCQRRQNINLHPASPAPDYRYFDRHSRCHDYTHMHDILLHDRPQTACDLEPCSLHSRPVSAMSSYSRTSTPPEELIDTMKQPKRYINYHRPKTAPSRGSEGNFQRRGYGLQGYRPRFCNIVKSMQLHSREGRDMSPCTGDSGFDEFDYFTKDGRMINRWRKESTASYDDEGSDVFEQAKGAGSGLDGKPGTPTSINEDLDRMDLTNLNNEDYDPESIELVPPVVIVERLQDDEDDLLKKKRHIHTLTIPNDTTYRNTDDDHNRASESPTQPPPSPDVSFSKEPVKPPSPPKIKKPITKKTLEKKPFNKKKKEDMEKPVEVPPQPREPTPPPPPPVEEKKEPEIVVNLPEPSLPEFKEPASKQKKEKNKPEKFAIPKTEKPKVEDDSLFNDALTDHLKKFELMVSDMTSPEESPKKHTNKPVKITGRLALSQQSSRFTLPMDMKELETMTPKQYIVKYCKITKRRQHLYDNVYRQTVGAVTKPMHYKELEKALKNVLVDTLNHEHYQYICELLEIKEGEDINSDLFAKMSALAERLLYPQYVTKETEDHKDYQKELIEVADFSALEWKFHGVNVRPDIQKLLKTLC
ncbi:Hypothetical predicted protein [Mytilus galloprovincialis]|uniref:Uncharacterized protein n=1 Tax=Mytilus galloprovincialis TaxID=29158 RepID=A0A8B6C6C9_MYTGA|nr:Hypothetical predicted protein [Mytilus galloprovincialis]